MDLHDRPTLHLIKGGRDEYLVGVFRLSLFSPRISPHCDAVLFEEDSWQILAAGTDFTVTREHPIRIWTELLDTEPTPPGSVILREGWPITMLAVVYDFDAFPCCRSRWITAALAEAFKICRERRVKTLLLPLPGVRHGSFTIRKSLRLVIRALRREKTPPLQRILLACGSEDEEKSLANILAVEAELWSRSGH